VLPKVQASPPKAVPALRTPPAEQNITANDMTVKENTEAPHVSTPVVADPAPAPVVAPPPPPPPPKEEPITEATGYAGYMKNPAPEYPAQALRLGLEGKVVLRVRVLANGTPGSVEVKQSSGKRILDDAAIAAVKGWAFSPSKRGSTPIDGWATVPLEFKISQ
jgi:protein TonB